MTAASSTVSFDMKFKDIRKRDGVGILRVRGIRVGRYLATFEQMGSWPVIHILSGRFLTAMRFLSEKDATDFGLYVESLLKEGLSNTDIQQIRSSEVGQHIIAAEDEYPGRVITFPEARKVMAKFENN